MKVLTVDDDPGILFMLDRAIRSCGHEASAYSDPKAAWEAYQATPHPVVILDRKMRGMDGLDLCRRIRSAPGGDRAVILLVTAYGTLEDLQEILDAGADDFLPKPFRVPDLKARLAIAVRKVARAEEHEQARHALSQALQHSQLLAAAVDSLPTGVAISDPSQDDNPIVFVNPGFVHLTGYAAEEAIGRNGRFLHGVEKDPAALAALREATDSLRPFRHVLRAVRKDGSAFWDELALTPVFNDRGDLAHWVGLHTDVTERVEARQALGRARRQQRETAARIQRQLLLGETPRAVIGLQTATVTVPSGSVGGDFHETLRHGETCLDVLIGDVSGQGIDAALLGAEAKVSLLRALGRLAVASPEGVPPEPEAIVREAHRQLAPRLRDRDARVTLCYARFDLRRKRVRYVDCGHTMTVHCRPARSRCDLLKGRNAPLGPEPDGTWESATAAFEPNDVFVFYSDGLSEAANSEQEPFGPTHLADVVMRCAHLSPAALTEAVCEAARHFVGADTLGDDLTCLAVKIAGADSHAPLVREVLDAVSDLTRLGDLRRFVRNFCAKAPSDAVTEEVTDRMVLAVNEAASNIMRHAYAGDPHQRLRIEAEAYADRLCVDLYDIGKSFDARRVPRPRLDSSATGGLGLYIMEQCCDEVTFSRTPDGRNCTSLITRLRRSPRRRP